MRVVNLNLQPGYIQIYYTESVKLKNVIDWSLKSDDAIPLSLTFLKGVSRLKSEKRSIQGWSRNAVHCKRLKKFFPDTAALNGLALKDFLFVFIIFISFDSYCVIFPYLPPLWNHSLNESRNIWKSRTFIIAHLHFAAILSCILKCF